MASYETLPSGRIRAVVSIPVQGRLQKTFAADVEARAWASAIELRKHRGQKLPSRRTGRGLTLANYYAGWVELRTVASGTAAKHSAYWRTHIEPMWGRAALTSITARKLDAWVAGLVRAAEIKPATIRGVVYLLSAIMRGAVKDGALDANPVASMEPLPKVEPIEYRIVDADEIRLVVKALEEPYATLYLLAWQTGLRWAELAGVPVRAVDLERRVLHVVQVRNRDGKVKSSTKNGKHRIVPLTAELAERLAALIEGRTASEFVFTNPRSGAPLDYHRTYGRVWRPAIEAAGLDPAKLRPRQHDMRHSAGTNMLEGGVRIDHVRDILGHGDTRMTEKYTHRVSDGFDTVRAVFDRPS